MRDLIYYEFPYLLQAFASVITEEKGAQLWRTETLETGVRDKCWCLWYGKTSAESGNC